jgi:hypothetical protein
VGLVRVRSRLAERSALAKQVPAAVELDLDVLQPTLVVLELAGVVCVGFLATPEPVLLGNEVLDSCGNALVAHVSILTTVRRADTIDPVSDASALIDELANELATWPGVRIERRADGAALVVYEHSELGVLYPDRGVAELPVLDAEHDELIEHGDAEPAVLTPESSGVSHDVRGPSDLTAALELFDRRYRDVRGEGDPYSSEDPGYRD